MSLITETGSIFDDPFEELLRRLADRLDLVAREVAIESHRFSRYEEPTTSRLAGLINTTLSNHPITVPGLAIDVHLEEFKKVEEHVNGADLYVSLVLTNTSYPVSKGMLVQAKRHDAILRSGEPQRLGNQCKRMRRRSKKASYVWIYEDSDILSVKAPQASAPLLQRVSGSSSVGSLITNGLRCNAGDEGIGRDAFSERVSAIRAEMDLLSVPRGLEIAVRPD